MDDLCGTQHKRSPVERIQQPLATAEHIKSTLSKDLGPLDHIPACRRLQSKIISTIQVSYHPSDIAIALPAHIDDQEAVPQNADPCEKKPEGLCTLYISTRYKWAPLSLCLGE
jgi:hypothetical protein